MPWPSLMDEEFLPLTRAHITGFLRFHVDPAMERGEKVLEIGPKLGWPGMDTLDIDPAVKATFCADICAPTPIPNDTYDMVLAISVLEHTIDPWAALTEIRRITKPGGVLLAQAPLNFRIHGPLPDLWRFTEHGWRVLLKDWDDVKIEPLESPERPLFPIAYVISARCNKEKMTNPNEFQWRWIK